MNDRRSGISRVEVAVVTFFLIPLVLSLFAPAIQQVRESARRNHCNNHLKQYGLALHNYHGTHCMFPSGYVGDPDGVPLGWGWQFALLPFLGLEDVYLELEPFHATGLRSSPVSTKFAGQRSLSNGPRLRCPSDRGSTMLGHVAVRTGEMSGGAVAQGTTDFVDHFWRSNYFGVAGYLPKDAGGIELGSSWNPPSSGPLLSSGGLGNAVDLPSAAYRYCDRSKFRGVFGQNSANAIDGQRKPLSLNQITDGTSYTMTVGERYSPANNAAGSVGHGAWIGVPDPSTAAGLATALGDTAVPLNAGLPSLVETTGFGSVHKGGSQFLFADGGVRFITNKISLVVYRAYSTIDGGDLANCDF